MRSKRPLLLDLFCGAGGAAVGYHRAGFDVVGVDIQPQPRYPFEFRQAHALDHIEGLTMCSNPEGFAAVHASPPCQHYSDLAKRNGNAHEHPDLVATTRDLLANTGLLYVIENVEGAPLHDPVTLCGTTFAGLRVIRHRLFESNFPLAARPCSRPHPLCFTRDKRKRHYGMLDERTAFVSVNGGGNCSRAAARSAMGIDWMSKGELNEAIPPAYTEYVGKWLLDEWRARSLLAASLAK